MDGTIVDSEPLTEKIIKKRLSEERRDFSHIDFKTFHGATWQQIENDLKKEYPGTKITIQMMEEDFHESFKSDVEFFPKAENWFEFFSKRLPTTIVSSSNRRTIDLVFNRIECKKSCSFYIGAEDFRKSKPAPDAYIEAANKLGLKPEQCLVFEDSLNGISSASIAKSKVIAVGYTKCSANYENIRSLTPFIIKSFKELDLGFLEKVFRSF